MKRIEPVIVTVARNKINLPKLSKKLLSKYTMSFKGDRIILDPVKELISEREQELYAPENKELLKQLKKALKQKSGFKSFEDVKKRLKLK
jgi:hypothetical protein